MDIRRRIFHKATIGGQCFNGVLLNEGPYLFWGNGANVPIGVAGLRYYVEPPEIGHKPLSPGWWMVKYGKELRMDLHWLTDTGAEKLSSEFGIIYLERNFRPRSEGNTSLLRPPGMDCGNGSVLILAWLTKQAMITSSVGVAAWPSN